MSLAGRITLVTGASRGIGRGCAKALADQGATVYITGRKLETLSKTAQEIGGNVIPVVCDHSNDDQVENLFKQIDSDNSGRLDMIVNNCYAAVTTLLGKESSQAVDRFWEQPPQIWDTVNNVGLRANYIASVFAARLMVPRGAGLIVNMSSPGGLTYLFNTAYGVGKAAQDRMAQDFNVELRGTGVKALSIWPGAVKTELIVENILEVESDSKLIKNAKKGFEKGQSTEWVGKTVAALLSDPNIDSKAGRVIWCHDIADEFDIKEVDGSHVTSIRSLKNSIAAAHMQSGVMPWYLPFIPETLLIPSWLFKIGLWMRGNKF